MRDETATVCDGTKDAAAVSVWPAVLAGLVAAIVGFGSTFAVVLQGLEGVGATPAQAASGLFALCLGQGVLAIVLGLKLRMPVAMAWSTPGAALLAATGPVEGGFAAAVGAFLVSGMLVIAAGLWRPLGRAVLAIPAPLANAMLAGVLLGFCIAPFKALGEIPLLALPVIVAWAVVGRFARLYAAPAAVAVAGLLVLAGAPGALPAGGITAASIMPDPVWIAPAFTWQAMVSIALPLFLVTMASQNIPGFAVLAANGYTPPPAPLLVGTGAASVLVAPFGGHALNLAAITAALCAGPDAHPDPARRYVAAVVSGFAYLAFAAAVPVIASLVAASPPLLVQAVAGLALIGAFAAAAGAFLTVPDDREAALVTFVATASGVSLFGIGSAFWGLVAGGLVVALYRLTSRA